MYLADDHPIYRQGLADAIKGRPDLELVGEAADGRTALDEIRELIPDVSVIDLAMPELSGFEVLNAIQRDGVATKIVVLSANTESEAVFRAVAEGAVAYIPKEADREEVCDAIAAASRGDVVLSSDIQAGLANEIRLRGKEERTPLTPRESDVLKLTAEGLSAPEIGFQLHISAATVKTHMQSAYEKLGVSDRAAAVAAAMRQGLLE
ncbi:MAG TPA: response regulator transcription factor [Solirubrobacterales bacterium]|nr:response regulator transcription factor [Solirubrobacterales bacterium]